MSEPITTGLKRKEYLAAIKEFYEGGADKTGVGAITNELFGSELSFSRWQFVGYVYDQVRRTKSPIGQKLLEAKSFGEVREHLMEVLGENRFGPWNPFNDETYIPKPTQEELDAIAEKALKEMNAKLSERGQLWQFQEGELIDITAKFKALGETKLAEICGYFHEDQSGKRTVLVDKYKEALKEFENFEVGEGDYEEYFLINDRIAVPDGQHFGNIFVPKRCILADKEFYDINEFEEYTKEYLRENMFMNEEEIKEEIESFEEPMMLYFGKALFYLEDDDCVSYEDELKTFGIKPEDVHPSSAWHDD